MLGVLQGVTEFFPVSSSGHLGLAEILLGIDGDAGGGAGTEVALHVGTLLAVFVFLRHDLRRLLAAPLGRGGGPEEVADARRLLVALAVATLPAAVVGLAFEEQIERLFGSPWVLGAGFLATGALLVLSRALRGGDRAAPRIGLLAALLVGCAQTVAMVPGISRSGSTIVAAMALGLAPAEAGRFSFLMSIPVIGGAALLKAGDILAAPADELVALLAGVAAAFCAGLLALRYLTLMLRRGRLFAFAFYVIPLGLFALYVASRA